MSKYNWDERHITFPEEKGESLSTKICMSIMERTSPLKASTCSLKKWQITALIGPSGSGKSTYLREFEPDE